MWAASEGRAERLSEVPVVRKQASVHAGARVRQYISAAVLYLFKLESSWSLGRLVVRIVVLRLICLHSCRAAPEGDKAIEGQKWQPTGSGDGPKGPKRGSYVWPIFDKASA